MISKIGYNSYLKNNFYKKHNNINNKNNYSYQTLPSDKVCFTGSKSKNDKDKKFENIMLYADASTKKLFANLWNYAKETEYDTITPMHVISYSLAETKDFLNDLDNGVKDYSSDKAPEMVFLLGEAVNYAIFSDKELRAKIKPIIEKYVDKSHDKLLKEKPETKASKSEFSLSDELVDYIWSYRKKENETVTPDTVLLSTAGDESNEDINKFIENLFNDISDVIMQNNKNSDGSFPFSGFDEKADNVIKNLFLGTDMFVTYDYSKENAKSFLDTVRKNLQKLDKDNLKYLELNEYATADYLVDTVNKAKKDKDHEYVIAADPSSILLKLVNIDDNGTKKANVSIELINSINEKPANIRFLFYDTKNNYYTFLNTSLYQDFQEVSIPTLNSQQMVKFFKENPNVMKKDVKIPFSKTAVEKTVIAASQMDGVFPDKVIDLMKKIASYNVNKREITEADVNSYIKEAEILLKKSNDNNSVEIVYDTGKHVKQLTGKLSTKKEAEQIVKLIKTKKLGTKGIMIYSQDGMPGSGRKFTAKAIAGDARVPYIEVNTMDFGTKDVDLFGSGLSPEQSMKKLFSLVTTQAEANPSKSVVLFIENFEYFSVGEMVSNYHQKAMAQLLREMEKAQNMGLNILVIGSVSDPDLVGEATMKSFKFIDQIEVSSPAYNKLARNDIIKQAIKEQKLRLFGSDEEKDKLVSYASDITIGFPYIYLQNLIKKTKSVMSERGHKFITKADLTEAYLQLTTGRPAMGEMQSHEKNIVASHECGHAVNLEVMNNLAKLEQKPWRIPQKVNFVTLDPRGMYGGAVYHGDDINAERTFEFAFSEVVCCFGGNSAENLFYNIDGSWGITSDMGSARAYSERMVNVMGMGAKTGKMSVQDLSSVSDNMKQILESDQRVILNNAKITSDLITEIYQDFNKEFTKKYSSLVGTGNCLVDGDEFRNALNEWKRRQSPQKQKELAECDKAILEIIDATKRGVAVQRKK